MNATPARPWIAWLRPIAPAALYLSASALLVQGLVFVGERAALPLTAPQLATGASAAATLFLAPLALDWDRRDARCVDGAPKKGPPSIAATAVFAGLALGILATLVARILPGAWQEGAAPGGPGGLVALRVVALCLTGPLCEEAVYRGLVLRRGEALMGSRLAALLSAALFAVGHGTIAGMASAFAAGCVFAHLALWGRRAAGGRRALLAPFLCHASANAATLVAQALLAARR